MTNISIFCKVDQIRNTVSDQNRLKKSYLDSGAWDDQAPVCEPIVCPPPLAPDNGRVKGSARRFQDSVVYECDQGFTLIGSQVCIMARNEIIYNIEISLLCDCVHVRAVDNLIPTK